MRQLENIEPERVFYYFEELTKIPHGSYNVDMISDYIYGFGKTLGLETYQDELKNVIIIKEASAGYESEPPIILQGHMDMVAVHKPELDIDMKTEGLKARVYREAISCEDAPGINNAGEKDYVYAEGTSLGGDDGIAVAYAMALLEDETLKHPRMEVVITTNEETGMEGANGIDLSILKGSRLLNLDNEEEGAFITSCAGGIRAFADIPIETAEKTGTLYEIEIGGLLGGHSGEEIDKERGNSNKLAGRLLYESGEIYITHLDGGLADNAIPRETKLGVVVMDTVKFEEALNKFTADVKAELSAKDPGFYCKVVSKTEQKESIKVYDGSKAVSFLYLVPNGVRAMSSEVKGMVETSLNLGIVKIETEINESKVTGADGDKSTAHLHTTFLVRSSLESAKYELAKEIDCLAGILGGKTSLAGDYPGWPYRSDSPLREKMVRIYTEMFGKAPKTCAIHAGLECGILAGKISNLDCVSIGPDMKDIHTTEEKLYIESTRRTYEFVRALIESR